MSQIPGYKSQKLLEADWFEKGTGVQTAFKELVHIQTRRTAGKHGRRVAFLLINLAW